MKHFLNDTELACWLALNRVAGLGPRRFASLLSLKQPLATFFNQRDPGPILLDWCKQQGIPNWETDWHGVERDLKWAEQPNTYILTVADPLYPEQLKQINAHPPVLFVWGDPTVLNRPQIALVGSRHPTAYGKRQRFILQMP